MFIELTDHLRCPAAHDEAFLVLIPDTMRGRTVLQGSLGCPVCHRVYPIADAVLTFGQAEPAAERPDLPTAEALLAFLGLEGPGGFVALVGSVAARAAELGQLLPGVHCVAVNPPAGLASSAPVSIIRSPWPPLKARSCRGVVLGAPEAHAPAWSDVVGSVLPGLRVVGEGPPPDRAGLELLASAAGWWVARAH